MKSIGFNFTKNDFRYCVLEKTPGLPKIIEKQKIVYPKSMKVEDLMEWFETQLTLLIDNHRPEKISHKISLHIKTIDQIKSSCYPQAILNLIAKKKNIYIIGFSSQAINATKFGEPKKTDVFAYLNSKLGNNPPYWDKPTKEAVLVSWYNIL